MRRVARVLVLAAASSALLAGAPASASPCTDLTQLVIPRVAITSATDVAAGPFTAPSEDGRPAAPVVLPAFCRVEAAARPTADSDIRFEVWLPARDWNGKFEGVGNGAYIGSVAYGSMMNALARGYAAGGTDSGHTGSSPAFAENHPEKGVDWAQRSVHVMTDAAKLVVRNFYGRLPAYSYFTGCSTGGMQALSEAQRFPDDYDGIVAGDPGNNRTSLNVGFLWAYAALHETPASVVPSAKLPAISRAAVAACDAADGVQDGLIGDPLHCQFDPAVLRCTGAETDACLTGPQIDAVRKIYAGPHNPRTGEQIMAGYEPGSENPTADPTGGWVQYMTGVSEPIRLEYWKFWVFDNPKWDWRSFDWDRDVAFAHARMTEVDAVSPDLRAFRARGGKLIMYSGWDDPVGPPRDAIHYYESVAARMGGIGALQPFYRLFMVPGMAHCTGGPGPSLTMNGRAAGVPEAMQADRGFDAERDVVTALDRWITLGVAPAALTATHRTGARVDRTRPVCPYPQVARWTGRGSTDDAQNFVCAAPSR